MLGFNAIEFQAINRLCPGVTARHRHAKWGFDPKLNRFATSSETAYPLILARRIGAQFVLALKNCGIKAAPEVLAEVSNTDASSISVLRAQTGVQPKASKLPPLIPTFAARIS